MIVVSASRISIIWFKTSLLKNDLIFYAREDFDFRKQDFSLEWKEKSIEHRTLSLHEHALNVQISCESECCFFFFYPFTSRFYSLLGVSYWSLSLFHKIEMCELKYCVGVRT